MTSYYIGCDVGTGSVRAGLVDQHGKLHVHREKKISIKNYNGHYYEQSSVEIWRAVCDVIRQVTSAVARKEEIRGVGFCATCSLVLLDRDLKPCPINPDVAPDYDVIMWMDHRADAETKLINDTDDDVIKYVGGKMSLEMEIPKILWMKRHRPEQFSKFGHLFDLPDFLTYKATGARSRSLCSVGCKWTYVHGRQQSGWSADFFRRIGLEELVADNFAMIGGDDVKLPGSAVGDGLTGEAAADLNLCENTSVATSLIDAHCGGIGMIGCDGDDVTLSKRLAMICGTSSCLMASSARATFVPGVWGPYYSAMLPGYWLNEGGQSAVGKLLDHVIDSHPAVEAARKLQRERGLPHLPQLLNQLLEEKFGRVCDVITRHLHVWPDYHGNRSPVADSALCGAVCGLKLDASIDDLLRSYLATVQALALGTRHIADVITASRSDGDVITQAYMCGGLSKNELFRQIHADVLGMDVVTCREEETVIVGGAVLAALAAGDFPTAGAAMRAMSHAGTVTSARAETRDFYEAKYRVFKLMLGHQLEYRDVMNKCDAKHGGDC